MRHILIVFSFLFAALAITPQAVAQEGATPEKAELVRRYFKAMDFDVMMDAMLKSMVPMMVQGEMSDNPELSAEDAQILSDLTIETMNEIMPVYVENLVEVYAEAFSHEELVQIVAFYESPVGQSIVKKTPALTPKVMEVMVALMPQIEANMAKKVCKRFGCETTPIS